MDGQPALDQDAVRGLLGRLDVEDGDVAVISFAARLEPDQHAWLVYASVLFGPAEMGAQSWPEWAAGSSLVGHAVLADLRKRGLADSTRAEFADVRDGWLFARIVMPTADGLAGPASWLTEVLNGAPVAVADGPLVAAKAGAAPGLIRTFPHQESAARQLAAAVHRPTTGYRFPLDPCGDATMPTNWEVDGMPVPAAARFVLGLASPGEPGLYVGGVDRRGAWIAGLKADNPNAVYEITVGIESDRINPADLEITFEEYLDNELAAARLVRLADLPPADGNPAAWGRTVILPSLGTKVSREVRLFDHDGVLIDRTDRLFSVEKIVLDISVGDMPPEQMVIGGGPPAQLLDRLALADKAEAEYRKLLEEGLTGRIIDDPASGLPLLRNLIAGAIGDISILDPYFGHQAADWAVLEDAKGNIRVLTGHGGRRDNNGNLIEFDRQGNPTLQVKQPPWNGAPPKATLLEVRGWWKPSAPWHDRVYLWANGGLTVGTSPSGLGKRVARIDRLTHTEASAWQRSFEVWWSSIDAKPI